MRRAARAVLSTSLAAVVALSLSACGGTQSVERTIDAVAVEGGAGFSPVTVTIDKRNRVQMTVGNATAAPHGFSIEGYGIQEEIAPGAALELEFTATNAGTYKIYCQLHEAHKTSTLVVR
jgi:nitrosocyanin